MNRETLDRWCERGILALVLVILIFGPLATGAVRTPDFLIIQSLAILAVALWALRLWLNSNPKILWPPICWAVVAFVIYAIARYLTSEIEYVARQELIHVLVTALLFFVIVNNFHARDSARIVTLSLVFLAMGISCYAIFQFATKSNHVWSFISPYKNRGTGTYISPNHLAGFLEMLLPLGLAWALAGRLKPVAKIFVGYASLVILAGIAVTVSRGGWISTTIALVILFVLLLFRRTYRIQSAALLVVMLAAAFFIIPNAYKSRDRTGKLYTEVEAEDVRFEVWRPTIEMWRDNFWFGVGPGQFDYRFRAYRPESVQLRPGHAHNDFLNTLADWGIAGTAIVAVAMVLLFCGIVKTWKALRNTASGLRKNKSNKFALLLGASVGLLAIFLHSAVDFNMHIPANAILAITLMAILTAHLRFATEKYWAPATVSLKWILTLCLLAGVSYLGCQGIRRTNEIIWLGRADRQLLWSNERMAALKEALEAEPKNFETTFRIAEELRTESLEGNAGYEKLAQQAMDWRARGMKLNPHDGYNYLFYGVCLDLLARYPESAAYFTHAEELDPNGYFTMAYLGRHYVEVGNLAAARSYFERSLRLQWVENPIAESYLEIVNRRLAETAAAEKKPAF